MSKTRRAIDAFCYTVSLCIGIMVGPVIGLCVGSFIIVQLQLDPILQTFILTESTSNAALGLSAFAGLLIYAPRFPAAWRRYCNLLELKHQHRLCFFEVRKYNYQPHTPGADFVWAYGFTIIEFVMLTIATVGTGIIVFHVLRLTISALAIFPAFLLGGLTAFPANQILQLLFWPHRLEAELRNAGQFINVIHHYEREQQRRLEEEGGNR